MARTLQQLLRPLVPNLAIRIRHIESKKTLGVRCREHLGLITRGAKSFEPKYVQALKALVNQGDTIFDVGANIGFYTILFSAWTGEHGRVLAYEPDPWNLEILARNIDRNGCDNTIIRPFGLSKRSGEELFSVDSITRSTGHLGGGPTFGENQFGFGREELITIKTKTLDEEASGFGAPVLIKMDIEGGELDALSGASTLLCRDRPLIASELNGWTKEDPSGTGRARQATRFLADHDYAIIDLDTGALVKPGEAAWMVFAFPKEKEDKAGLRKVLSGVQPGWNSAR